MRGVTNLREIVGGNPVVPAIAVVATAGSIITTLQACNKLGHDVGEWAYNKFHTPADLGPMNYQAIPNSYYYHAW